MSLPRKRVLLQDNIMISPSLPRRAISVCLFGTILGLTSVSAAIADPAPSFQGAWAVAQSDCSDTFTMRNGVVALKNPSDTMTGGFIIRNRKIIGNTGSCSVLSKSLKGKYPTYQLACHSTIMFGSPKVSVYFKDPDTLVRYNPDLPDVTTEYYRCTVQ